MARPWSTPHMIVNRRHREQICGRRPPAVRDPVKTALAVSLLLAAPALGAGQIPLIVGKSAPGRLLLSDPQFSDSTHYKMYAFVGAKGDTITADLTSDDFDANLELADASGNMLRRNDDGGGSCNARVSYVLPATGNYRLYANTEWAGELGAFQISIMKGRRPVPADTTCADFGRTLGTIQVGQTLTAVLGHSTPVMR